MMLDGFLSQVGGGGRKESESVGPSASISVLVSCLLPAQEMDCLPREKGTTTPLPLHLVPGHQPGPVRVCRGRKGHNQHHASRRRLPEANAMHAHQIIPDGTHPVSPSFFFAFVFLAPTARRALHAHHPTGRGAVKRWNWRIAEKRDAGMQTRPRKRSPKRILARLHLPSPSWTVPASRIVAWDVGPSGLWPVLGKPCIPIAREWGYGAGDATPARSLTELDKPEAPNWAGRGTGVDGGGAGLHVILARNRSETKN